MYEFRRRGVRVHRVHHEFIESTVIVKLIALGTSEAEEAAAALIKRAATAFYLQDVYDGRTIALFKELIDTALVHEHAVKDVGGALALARMQS